MRILTRPAARDGNLESPSTELGHHDDPGHRPDFWTSLAMSPHEAGLLQYMR